MDQGRFNNAYELVNLRPLKYSTLYEIVSVDITVPLDKNPHSISYPYIERYTLGKKKVVTPRDDVSFL